MPWAWSRNESIWFEIFSLGFAIKSWCLFLLLITFKIITLDRSCSPGSKDACPAAWICCRAPSCFQVPLRVSILLGHQVRVNVVAVQSLSCVWLFVTPWTAAFQAILSFTISWSLLNTCPSSQLCHPTVSSSVTPFSSCPQSFPASGSFQMSWLFSPNGQSTGASASTSVLPMTIQGWFPLGLTAVISLQSKGLSRRFLQVNTAKHPQVWNILPLELRDIPSFVFPASWSG